MTDKQLSRDNREINFHSTFKQERSIPEKSVDFYSLNDIWDILVLENSSQKYEIMLLKEDSKNLWNIFSDGTI